MIKNILTTLGLILSAVAAFLLLKKKDTNVVDKYADDLNKEKQNVENLTKELENEKTKNLSDDELADFLKRR